MRGRLSTITQYAPTNCTIKANFEPGPPLDTFRRPFGWSPSLMAATNWKRRFDEPIKLPDGGKLVTPKDAADYIMGLPKKVHDAPHWQLAMAQLIDAAEGRNFIMHARIAVLKALNHGLHDPKTEPRRKAIKKHRIVR